MENSRRLNGEFGSYINGASAYNITTPTSKAISDFINYEEDFAVSGLKTITAAIESRISNSQFTIEKNRHIIITWTPSQHEYECLNNKLVTSKLYDQYTSAGWYGCVINVKSPPGNNRRTATITLTSQKELK